MKRISNLTVEQTNAWFTKSEIGQFFCNKPRYEIEFGSCHVCWTLSMELFKISLPYRQRQSLQSLIIPARGGGPEKNTYMHEILNRVLNSGFVPSLSTSIVPTYKIL